MDLRNVPEQARPRERQYGGRAWTWHREDLPPPARRIGDRAHLVRGHALPATSINSSRYADCGSWLARVGSITSPANQRQRKAAHDGGAAGETVSHGCRVVGRAAAGGRLEHVRAMYRRYRDRFDEEGWALPGYPLFPDRNGDVCTKERVTATIRRAAQLLGHALRWLVQE